MPLLRTPLSVEQACESPHKRHWLLGYLLWRCNDEQHLSRRIDVLAIGLFGLAIDQISEIDKVGVLVVALVFGGLVQVIAGVAEIR